MFIWVSNQTSRPNPERLDARLFCCFHSQEQQCPLVEVPVTALVVPEDPKDQEDLAEARADLAALVDQEAVPVGWSLLPVWCIRQIQQGSVKCYANVIFGGFPVLSHFSEFRDVIFNKLFSILLLIRFYQTMAQIMQKDLNFDKTRIFSLFEIFSAQKKGDDLPYFMEISVAT